MDDSSFNPLPTVQCKTQVVDQLTFSGAFDELAFHLQQA
jgi:hypothetical protein